MTAERADDEAGDVAPARPWTTLGARVRAADAVEPWVAAAVVESNLRRLATVGRIAVLVSVGHLAVFLLMDPVDARATTWRTAILVAHASLASAMAVLVVLAGRTAERATIPHPGRWVQLAALTVVMVAGIGIALADQLVTSSITPFLVACVVCGTVVAVRPRWSLVLFGSAVGAFGLLLAVVDGDPATLASNRVNGLTFAGLGFGLSLLRWNADVRDLRQREHIARQQRELERRNRELGRLAASDELTGLLNRREFQLLVGHELRRLRRAGSAATLLLVDLDRFKDVNDRFGHPVGDALLVAVAAVLRTRARAADLVARWGGEEFIIFLPEVPITKAHVVAETYRHLIEERCFEVEGHELRLTISVGVADVVVDGEDPFAVAYRKADDALYAAKHAGRNQVVVAPA